MLDINDFLKEHYGIRVDEFSSKSSTVYTKNNEYEIELRKILKDVIYINSIKQKNDTVEFEVKYLTNKKGKEILNFDTYTDAEDAEESLNKHLKVINKNLNKG